MGHPFQTSRRWRLLWPLWLAQRTGGDQVWWIVLGFLATSTRTIVGWCWMDVQTYKTIVAIVGWVSELWTIESLGFQSNFEHRRVKGHGVPTLNTRFPSYSRALKASIHRPWESSAFGDVWGMWDMISWGIVALLLHDSRQPAFNYPEEEGTGVEEQKIGWPADGR